MDIQHDIRQRKFYTIIGGVEYSLEYNEVSSFLWEFHCNFISNQDSNLNEVEIRNKLIEYAIYYMKRNGIQMIESGCCEQVREFVDRKKTLEYLVKHPV